MTNGQKLVLAALKKERAAITKELDKASAEILEIGNAPSEYMTILEEVAALCGEHTNETLAKLKDLSKKEKRIKAIMAKDYIKALGKENEIRLKLWDFDQELSVIEYRYGKGWRL